MKFDVKNRYTRDVRAACEFIEAWASASEAEQAA